MKYGMIFPMNCQNIKTLKRSFYGSCIVTNSLDPDQAQHFGSKQFAKVISRRRQRVIMIKQKGRIDI